MNRYTKVKLDLIKIQTERNELKLHQEKSTLDNKKGLTGKKEMKNFPESHVLLAWKM